MRNMLDHRLVYHALLVLVWALLALPNLGQASLWDIDEGNNASCSQEMLESGNWVIPTMNYQLREDKPALLYWLQAAAYQVCGTNELGARLPSALAALLALLATCELGRRLFGPSVGLLAAVILASSVAFVAAGHFANPDALLNACTLLALFSFWMYYSRAGAFWLPISAAACGLGMLAKGPVGLVLPLAVTVLFLLWRRQLRRLLTLDLLLATLVFVLVAAPWYIWVGVETKGQWLVGFFYRHNFERATTPLENHGGPFFYYLLILLVGFTPWSIFLGPTAWLALRRLRRTPSLPLFQRVREVLRQGALSLFFQWVRRLFHQGVRGIFSSLLTPFRAREDADESAAPLRPAVQFLLCWIAVYLVSFSIARTKLPNYILPLYPAVALLTASLLDGWRRGTVVLPAWLPRVSLASLLLTGLATSLGLLVLAGRLPVPFKLRHIPELAPLAGLGGILVAGALIAAWHLHRRQTGRLIVTLAVTAVAFLTVGAGWGIKAMNPCKAPRELARALPADQLSRDVRIAAFSYFQPSLVFYCQREVERPAEAGNAVVFLCRPLPCYLVVPAQTWEPLQASLPWSFPILARHHDLYTNQDILLITNEGVKR